MYLISACLLGENCKYNGGNNYARWVEAYAAGHSHMPVCPEVYGGLPVPRPPAEISGNKVLNDRGEDWTRAFTKGAEQCCLLAEEEAERRGETIEGAILKTRSPSCGCGEIYDGTFTQTLTAGDGYLTRLLKEKKIKVITEKEIIEDD